MGSQRLYTINLYFSTIMKQNTIIYCFYHNSFQENVMLGCIYYFRLTGRTMVW